MSARMHVGDLASLTVRDPVTRYNGHVVVSWQGPLVVSAIYLGSIMVKNADFDPITGLIDGVRHYYFGDFRPNADEGIVCAWDLETVLGSVAGFQEFEFDGRLVRCRVTLLSAG